MLEQVLRLMDRSPHHRGYSVDTILRCIVPPLQLGQYAGIERGGRLVAWASWAWLPPAKAEPFLKDAYKIQPQDWCSGDALVFMDFIAPDGDALRLFGHLKRTFDAHPAAWVRFAKHGKIVRVNHGK